MSRKFENEKDEPEMSEDSENEKDKKAMFGITEKANVLTLASETVDLV